MIEFENLQEFMGGIERWVEECEDLADGAFRGLVLSAFTYMVQGTPEWSGNLAASWHLTMGAPSIGYSESIFKEISPSGVIEEPFSRVRPNYAAIQAAIEQAKAEQGFIRLGADVFITNNAPYATAVELNQRPKDGAAFIRSVNLPVEMVHAAYDKFGGLGEISAARAKQLAMVIL